MNYGIPSLKSKSPDRSNTAPALAHRVLPDACQHWAVKWFGRRAVTPCHVTTALPVMPFKPKALPPAADLWERYSYNPLTGELFSLRRPSLPAVGRTRSDGYRVLHLKWANMEVAIHRVIWKWLTGSDPIDTIDHINRVRDKNIAWNLREADPTLQARNHSNCKLSVEKAAEIRALRVSGWTYRAIGERFGINSRTAHQVCSGETWKPQ